MNWYNSYFIHSSVNPNQINKYKDFFLDTEKEVVDDLEKEYTDSL